MSQAVLKSTSEFTTCLQDVTKVLQAIGELVDAEHDAIRRSSLDDVERIAAQKLRCSEDLEAKVQILRQASTSLADSARAEGLDPIDVGNISAGYELSVALLNKLIERGERGVKPVLDRLKFAFDAYVEARNFNHPKLSVNKMVLSKVLAHRQENYRFWQELSADMMASYDQKGVQKAREPRSLLNVKA